MPRQARKTRGRGGRDFAKTREAGQIGRRRQTGTGTPGTAPRQSRAFHALQSETTPAGAAMPQEHRAGAGSALAPEGDPGVAVMTGCLPPVREAFSSTGGFLTGCPATLAVENSSSRRKVSLAARDSDDGRHPPGRFSHPCRRSGCRRGYCSKKGRRIVRLAAARIPASDEEAPRVAKSTQYEPSFTPCFARRAWSVAKVQSLKGKSGKRSREKLSRTLRRGSWNVQ